MTEASQKQPAKIPHGSTEEVQSILGRGDIQSLSEESSLVLNDSAEQRKSEENLEKRLQQEAILLQIQSGAQVKFHQALNITPKVLEIPNQYPERPKRLAQRHNDLLITQDVVEAMTGMWKSRKAGDISEAQQFEEKLKNIASSAEKNGFFLFRYSEKFMNNRLQQYFRWKNDGTDTHRFIITEASGRHPDKAVHPQELHTRGLRAADCQIQLPMPNKNAEFVINEPQEGDEIHNPDWCKSVTPQEVAIVEDITSDPKMNKLRLASAAMDLALQTLIETNANRRGNPIKYLAAEIARLEGVILPDGTEIRLQKDLGVPPIWNDRSYVLFKKFQSNHCSDFKPYYTRKDVHHNVQLEGDQKGMHHQLIVEWTVMVAKVKSNECQS